MIVINDEDLGDLSFLIFKMGKFGIVENIRVGYGLGNKLGFFDFRIG